MSHRPTFRFAPALPRAVAFTTLAVACASNAPDSGPSAGTGGSSASSSGGVNDPGTAQGGSLTMMTGGSTSGGAPPVTNSGGVAANSGGATAANGGTLTSGGSSRGGRFATGGSSAGSSSPSTGGRSVNDASGGRAGAPSQAGNGGVAGAAGASTVPVPPGYKLVWHEEFDTDGKPDPANWNYENGFVRNEEAQWYQRDNASISGGLLVIEARKERVKNSKYTGSGDWKTSREYAEYTSTSMTTSGLQSWQYGRFEMRARIPTAAGMWPAWWTLGVSGEWPSNGEIDIMEFYQGKVLANVACGTSTRWTAKWSSSTKSLSALGADFTSSFHVWRMDWDEQNITLSMDDEELNTTPLSSMLNPDGKSPFKQKAYMIVNLAIGGQNGGDPSRTSFPQRYEIDYIRVFQKE